MTRQDVTRLFGLILAATTALVSPAMAAAQTDRIRGTIESVDGSSMTMQTLQGDKVNVALTDATKYVTVVKVCAATMFDGRFTGRATKGSGDFLVALEKY